MSVSAFNQGFDEYYCEKLSCYEKNNNDNCSGSLCCILYG